MSKDTNFIDLERDLHEARNQINDSISQLATTAMKDSMTYQDAIKKLRDYGWKFTGETSNFMIDSAIYLVENRAMISKI